METHTGLIHRFGRFVFGKTFSYGMVAMLWLWWCGAELLAQPAVDTAVRLSPVQIRAERKSPQRENTLTSVQALQGTALHRFNPQQAAEVIKQLAGVNVKDYGGAGGMKTVSVRSLGAAHTAVAYDGVLLADAQNGQIDLGKINIGQIESLALYNGQVANIFQPARNFSAASFLRIENRSPLETDSGKHFSVAFGFGSFGQLTPSFAFRRKINPKFGISAHVRYDYMYGNYPFQLDLGGTVLRLKRKNSDMQSGNAEVNLAYRLSERHLLEGKFFYYGSERGLPGAVIYYYDKSTQRLEDQDFFGVLKHTWNISPRVVQKNVLKYNFSYNRFRDPDVLSQQKTDNRYRQQEVYLSSSTLYETAVKGLSFSGALDAAFGLLQANLPDFVRPNRSSLWLNVAGKYAHPFVEVMANGLLSAFFDRVRTGKRPKDAVRFTPFASIAVFPLGKRYVALRCFYKDIFRMPTFNDLYYSRVGNTSLRPEKVRQVDAGITVSVDRAVWKLEAAVDFYRNWVEDKIVAYPTSNLFIWSMFNVGKVEVTGWDASLQVGTAFGRKWPASGFRADIQGAFSLQDALDITDKQSSTYRHQVAYTPRLSGSFSFSLGMPYVELNYRVIFCGERYALNENTAANRLAPYADQSLGLNTRFHLWKTEMEVGADLMNFMGKTYEVVKNYPMMGRWYKVHIRCRF